MAEPSFTGRQVSVCLCGRHLSAAQLGWRVRNIAVLVAIAVNEDGYREVLGAAEGMKEDKASGVNFFQWLKSRGLDGVKLIVGDKCLGMLEAVGEVFPDAKYQRCTVHFYCNVFSVVPRSKVKLVAKMLKAIHAQESKKAARKKAKNVAAQPRDMKLKEATEKVEDSVEETLTYCDFPYEHWIRIRTNNVIERLNRELCRGTRVAGTFPPAACGWHSVGQQRVHEHEALRGGSGRRLYCRLTSFSRSLRTNLRITLDGTLRFGRFSQLAVKTLNSVYSIKQPADFLRELEISTKIRPVILLENRNFRAFWGMNPLGCGICPGKYLHNF